MHYERIIKRAFQVTWRHKALWIFGIVAALFGGMRGGSGNGQGVQYALNSGDMGQLQSFAPWLSRGDWQRLVPMVLGLLALMAIVGVIMLIVNIIVRYTSLGALIGMVGEIEEKGETRFKSGLQTGWNRLLRLFAINLIIGLATGVIVIVLLLLLGVVAAAGAIPAALMISAGRTLRVLGIIVAIVAGLIVLLLMFLVFAALSALVTLVHEFSFRACVLERLGVFAALSAGIELVRGRLREGILFWLLLLGIDIALSLAAVPLVLLGLGGALVSGLVAFGLTESVGVGFLVGLPIVVVIVLASIFVGGLYLTFRSAAWTLAFRDLRGTAEPAGVTHLI